MKLALSLDGITFTPTHNAQELFAEVNIRTHVLDDLVLEANAALSKLNANPTATAEVGELLRRHAETYSTIRYFGVSKSGQNVSDWSISPRDIQVCNVLAYSFLQVNDRGFVGKGIPVHSSPRKVK